MANLYAHEAGPTISLDTELDLSTAATVSMLAIDPDGEEFVLAAVVGGTGSTSVIHTKTALTLNEEGAWVLHARATFAGGIVYQGDPYSLRIW